MEVKKQHLWILAFLAVLALNYYVTKQQADSALSRQRDALIVGCKRSSARTAVIAAWAFDASRTRGATGDKLAAARYEGYARAIIASIPATPAHRNDVKLVDVEEINNPRTSKLTYSLTDDARDLQEAGCLLAYPHQ